MLVCRLRFWLSANPARRTKSELKRLFEVVRPEVTT
jgi:hypothetical protein